MTELARVAVGLGSNVGDRGANLARGCRALEGWLRGRRCSRVYETEPAEGVEGGPFLNMCCVGRTSLGPEACLRRLLEAERAAGRVRGGRHGSARTLDMDLLLHGDAVVSSPDLEVPHPRMARRDFVLVPLAEVAGGWRHPGTGETVGEMADRVGADGVELYGGPLPADLGEAVSVGPGAPGPGGGASGGTAGDPHPGRRDEADTDGGEA